MRPSQDLRVRPVTDWEKRANELAAELRIAQARYNDVWDMLTRCDEDHLEDLHRLEDTEHAHNICKTRLALVLEDQAKKVAVEKENVVLKERVASLENDLKLADERRKKEKTELAVLLEQQHKQREASHNLVLGEKNGALSMQNEASEKRNVQLRSIIAQFKKDTIEHEKAYVALSYEKDSVERQLRLRERDVRKLTKQLEEQPKQEDLTPILKEQREQIELLEKNFGIVKTLLEKKIREQDELFKKSIQQMIAYARLEEEAEKAAANALGMQQEILMLAVRLDLMIKEVPDKAKANEILHRNLPSFKRGRRLE